MEFYSKEQVEKKGFVKENEYLWIKTQMGGKGCFVYCGGCKRFFDSGIVGNEAHSLECQCPFCDLKHRIPIKQ